MDQGGPREAAIRALIYVRLPEKAADERGFEMLRRIRAEHGAGKTWPSSSRTCASSILCSGWTKRGRWS
jgi:hypothetical protein